MQRITITLDDDLLAAIDGVVAERGYAGRSEAIRDLMRRGFATHAREPSTTTTCIANLTFVAEHNTRDLPQRIAQLQSQNHQIVLTQTQIPLDHDASLHAMVLRGPMARIKAFADELVTQRGVRHDHLAIIPANISARTHRHGGTTHHHEHIET